MVFGQKNSFIANSWLLMPFIAALFAVLLPQVMDRYNKAKVQTTIINIETMKSMVGAYKKEHGHYPTEQELMNGMKQFQDGWNRPIEYVFKGPSQPPEIISYGSDGKPGGLGFSADIIAKLDGSNPSR